MVQTENCPDIVRIDRLLFPSSELLVCHHSSGDALFQLVSIYGDALEVKSYWKMKLIYLGKLCSCLYMVHYGTARL